MKILQIYFLLLIFFSCTNSKFQPDAKATKRITIKYECPNNETMQGFPEYFTEKINQWSGDVVIKGFITKKDPFEFDLDLVSVADEQAFLDYLLSQVRVDFWNLYRVDEVRPFVELMEEKNLPWDNQMKGSSLFLYKNEADTATINDLLAANQELFPKDLIWKWRKKDDVYTDATPTYPLYALKGKPVLTSMNIIEAEAATSEYTDEPIINMNFDRKGMNIWARMTTQAYADDERAIGIMVNGKLWYAPRVSSPITSGQTTISGISTMEEVEKMVAHLSDGAFNYCEMEIVSIKNLD